MGIGTGPVRLTITLSRSRLQKQLDSIAVCVVRLIRTEFCRAIANLSSVLITTLQNGSGRSNEATIECEGSGVCGF